MLSTIFYLDQIHDCFLDFYFRELNGGGVIFMSKLDLFDIPKLSLPLVYFILKMLLTFSFRWEVYISRVASSTVCGFPSSEKLGISRVSYISLTEKFGIGRSGHPYRGLMPAMVELT